ncbi:hypothetical protein [Nocardioides donggukensis]|uniref:Uncharacterized protein n=1 Tax=Nocardioides donggukensis TaxID=2774019 RepID=A0A927K1X9_9ACTN|nr:hypothetical protein [Nocardioides donggukensis]MBD8868192.1 hypothetical protein [Nocardioides donggukensis]
MGRRIALLHVGPRAPHRPLADHHELLARAGCLTPTDGTAVETAAVEMLRRHREAGLRRRDVEGAWAGLCRRAHRAGRDTVLSQPRFAEATEEQAALILDALAGFEVHLVLTTYADSAPVAGPLETWAPLLPAGRVHVRRLEEGAGSVDLAEQLAGVVLTVRRRRLERRNPVVTRLRRWVAPREQRDLLVAS